MENNLKNHILLMEECMFGLTYTDVQRLACELAERNCFKHKFNKETKMAGYHWLYGFLRRNPSTIRIVPNMATKCTSSGPKMNTMIQHGHWTLQGITKRFSLEQTNYTTICYFMGCDRKRLNKL